MVQYDLASLRYAISAAELLSFSQAANRARIKQSTLSRHVAHLEQQIGLKLFERTTRGACLTKAGTEFVSMARCLLADLDELIASGHTIGTGRIGTVGLGFSTSLASGNMRSLIADFVDANPEVSITGLEADRDRLVQALHSRSIDFAVVSGDIPLEGLQRRPLWSERIMVVLPDEHELAGRERVYWTDLRAQRFIIARQDPGRDLAKLIAARLGEPGKEPDVATHDITRDNIIDMVSIGRFLSLTTDAALGRTPPGVVLREIHEAAGWTHHIDYAGYWREDNSTPTLDRLLKLIAKRYPG